MNITAMQRVSYAMQTHWTGFAAMGDPNAHSLEWIPKWPAYDSDGQAARKNFAYNSTLENVLNLHIEDDSFRTESNQLAYRAVEAA